jgi:poly(3-hydroxyalkanoate) synthetase
MAINIGKNSFPVVGRISAERLCCGRNGHVARSMRAACRSGHRTHARLPPTLEEFPLGIIRRVRRPGKIFLTYRAVPLEKSGNPGGRAQQAARDGELATIEDAPGSYVKARVV